MLESGGRNAVSYESEEMSDQTQRVKKVKETKSQGRNMVTFTLSLSEQIILYYNIPIILKVERHFYAGMKGSSLHEDQQTSLRSNLSYILSPLLHKIASLNANIYIYIYLRCD